MAQHARPSRDACGLCWASFLAFQTTQPSRLRGVDGERRVTIQPLQLPAGSGKTRLSNINDERRGKNGRTKHGLPATPFPARREQIWTRGCAPSGEANETRWRRRRSKRLLWLSPYAINRCNRADAVMSVERHRHVPRGYPPTYNDRHRRRRTDRRGRYDDPPTGVVTASPEFPGIRGCRWRFLSW